MKSTRVGDDKYAQPKGGSGGAALFRVRFSVRVFDSVLVRLLKPKVIENHVLGTFLLLRKVCFLLYFVLARFCRESVFSIEFEFIFCFKLVFIFGSGLVLFSYGYWYP